MRREGREETQAQEGNNNYTKRLLPTNQSKPYFVHEVLLHAAAQKRSTKKKEGKIESKKCRGGGRGWGSEDKREIHRILQKELG